MQSVKQFVRYLLSGNIDEKLYATYLYNQLLCYSKTRRILFRKFSVLDTKNLHNFMNIFFMITRHYMEIQIIHLFKLKVQLNI